MRLLYTTDVDLSRSSAQRTHVTEIVNGLSEDGFSIHLIALRKHLTPVLHENVELHEIIPIFNHVPFSLITRKIQRFQAERLVESILTKERIEVVYERQGCNLALALAKKLEIPIVMEINGVPSSECEMSINDEERKRIDEEWISTFQSADKIVAVSNGIKEILVSYGINESCIKVVTNGVNTAIFHPLNRQECRKAVGIPQNSRVAVFVGNFRPYHNLELLIRCVNKIVKRVPEFLLVLIGDSTGQGGFVHHPTIEELNKIAIKEGVQSHIRFIGRLDQVRLPTYINAADLGISLSYLSQTPIKNIEYLNPIKNAEYLACGLPVVCSKMNELNPQKDMVGVTVDLEEDFIANAIVELLLNNQLREEMGKKAIELVEEKYTWRLKSKEISMLLKGLIES
jgi:glycosyltransferase involved in cell wall biosynthesis